MSFDLSSVQSFFVSNACVRGDSCTHQISLILGNGKVYKTRLLGEEIDVLIRSIPKELLIFGGGTGAIDACRHFHAYEGRSKLSAPDILHKITGMRK